MISLSVMLAVKDATGSYAAAGAVMALFGLTSVFLSPARAALVDRHGPRRILPPMAAAYAVLLGTLAWATWGRSASVVLLAVLAVTAGACTPPLGPVMRTLWSRLVPDRRLLQRAYSLDAVAEELLFVTGPLLVGLLVTFTEPAAGVAVSAALVMTGTLALVSSPAVHPAGGSFRASADTTDPTPVPTRGTRLRVGAGLRQAIVVSAGVGLCLGSLDLLVVAFAEQRHQPEAVAWVLAALSAGSALGGLVYGAISWRVSDRLRLRLLAAALGVSLTASGFAPNLYVLVALVGLAGLFVAPALTTAYLIADESAAPGTRTQAGAWVNTAVNAGSSGGTAAAGLLIGNLPLAVCFVLAAVPALLSAAAAVNRTRWSVTTAPEHSLVRR
ncbi:MFS transporter [Streptosporangium soli]|nr:MFS transporter [Streptosporangium sp. KLBMP 9127]